ncbi:MAG: acetyl-CoA carboxylase biotin carboxylase subunit [Cyclobacteriaceae bacterium]|nr:acetyl-CoA carboxylase biotin carboxylase subunit [Cyclobacteriaceae bacterium]
MASIKKILIANRGEIALRVIRTAKEMGIKTVAVYSEADRKSPHVMAADEAVLIGPPPSAQSYLQGEKIIEACKKLNVDAIHPGYGFLSENADFAEKVEKAGLIFIGPSSRSIRIMGNKLAAKEAVSAYNIPMVPGTEGAISDPEEAIEKAKEIGYPILIKASAGGGGKGMRVVNSENEVEEQMKLAISEAISSFGDGSVFIEKYIESNKHIEVQILGDKHGKTLYFFERECSIQRRHQKVIEEAPSMVISEELRKEIGEAAVRVAQSCDYYGAGTVEFIYENGAFYFLEMNTRLQVEHPVTEAITGVDLVKLQIYVAEGRHLELNQEDLQINGHAFEVRVYAEDPQNSFLPDIGNLKTYNRPQGPGIRVDDGFEQGMDIPIYYDPMIAKLVTYGHTREEARQRMIRAIDEYQITGIKTTLPFCRFVFEHEVFMNGSFDTKFVEKHFRSEMLDSKNKEEEEIAALLAAKVFAGSVAKQTNHQTSNGIVKKSGWKQRLNN